MELLGAQPPDLISCFSDCFPETIEFVKKLIEDGCAYESNNGCPYYDLPKIERLH
jgi:cysteinyl-tRNA synthetase